MKKNGRKFRSIQKNKVIAKEYKEIETIIQDIKNILQKDNNMITYSVCNTKIEVDKSYIEAYKKWA